jgi:hypothetical protein
VHRPGEIDELHRRRKVVGVLGGVLGVACGLVGVTGMALFFRFAVLEREENSFLALFMWVAEFAAILFFLLGVGVMLLGVFAIRDSMRTQRGGAAGRLWLLFGIATAIGVVSVIDEWDPWFFALTLLSAATAAANFQAWRLRQQ